MTEHTFSLWLTPEGSTRDELASLIVDLAVEHGGPRFPPHITLLGSLIGEEAEVTGAGDRRRGSSSGVAPAKRKR